VASRASSTMLPPCPVHAPSPAPTPAAAGLPQVAATPWPGGDPRAPAGTDLAPAAERRSSVYCCRSLPSLPHAPPHGVAACTQASGNCVAALCSRATQAGADELHDEEHAPMTRNTPVMVASACKAVEGREQHAGAER
jgi:hypothetical protein